jgi:uncharacterized protein (DUF1697 family)
MTRNVALLRGINLGAHRKLAMADLRRLLSGLGYADVRTHLRSGNAVFTADGEPDALASEIEKAISAELDLTVPVLIRTAAELRAVVAANPLGDVATEPRFFYAIFLSGQPDPAKLAAVDRAACPERFAAGDRVIYVWYPGGMQRATLTHAFWERRLGLLATARNWNTVTNLCELAEVASR